MKKIIQLVLWMLCVVIGYQIYQSINAPIAFEKVKKERYLKVIDNLKDIRDSQEAYRKVNGKFADNFIKLVQFIDTAKFTILEKRDSSFMRYDKNYRIDLPVDTVVVDTLGFVSIKDSLFKDSDRYKTMMKVPFAADENKEFDIATDVLFRNGFNVPVFEVKVKKSVILHDQDKGLLENENKLISVDGVNGDEIYVGSLTEVSTSGNWPKVYDSGAKK